MINYMLRIIPQKISGTAKDAERRMGFILKGKPGLALDTRTGLAQDRRKGFTLVEILLVVSLVSVVGLALYSAFSNSLNIWDKINRDVPAENIDIFFDRIALDLRNCFIFSGMNFEGNNSHIAFPAIIKIQTTSGVQEQIGQVSYLLNSRDNKIYRRQSNFSEVYQGKIGQERKWDSTVSSIRFYYYYYDSEDEEYYWLDSWESKGSGLGSEKEEEFPLSVRVRVTVKDGDSEQVFTRTISIPFSHYTPRKES